MRCAAYLIAESADQALSLLAELDGTGRVIAGGTDLSLDRSLADDVTLVDISRLRELRCIEERDGHLHVGALCTHTDLTTSPLLRRKAAALSAAAASVGSPQIRNLGTVGGNVVNALPAADTAIALTALHATAEVLGPDGPRKTDLLSLYAGVGRSTVDTSREIVTGFSFLIPSGSGFQRLAKRKALALPVLNAAAAVWRDGGPECYDVGIAVGPVAVTPWRAEEAEGVLRGKEATREAIDLAARTALTTAVCRDSIRSCALYRQFMVEVLVRRALSEAAGLDAADPGAGDLHSAADTPMGTEPADTDPHGGGAGGAR